MISYDDPFWRIGRWEIGLFDDGWMVCRDRVVKFECRWPTYRTFHRR